MVSPLLISLKSIQLFELKDEPDVYNFIVMTQKVPSLPL